MEFVTITIMIVIATAKTSDLKSILEIIDDARLLIKNHGFKQWSLESNYPSYADFLKDINNNALYVAKDNDKIIGVMALYFGPDENYAKIDGKWLSNNELYSTIHRLAIKKEYYHQGVAKALINYAISLSKEKCSYIRIDTHKDNIMMNSLALKMGFSYCGIIDIIRDNVDSLRNAYERMI